MPVYTVKNKQTIVLHKCPFCSKPFEENANSQLVQILHLKMCPKNDDRQDKEKKQVKRLNERKNKKITNYFKRK
jgi:hypothetical protein